MSKLSSIPVNKKILLVVAHPDDEVLGPGGTVSKYALAGVNVDCLILGEGTTSRAKSRCAADPVQVRQLNDCARQAAQHLGINNLFFAGLPDNRFDSLDLLDIVKLIEQYVEQLHSERIYTHHAYDLNLDHQITFQAVLTACRPQQGCPVKELLCFETLSSTEWQMPSKEKAFTPNVFVDISPTIELKKKALAEYASELRNYPHPRSPEGIEIIARRWGLVVGKKFVEAFELIRMIED